MSTTRILYDPPTARRPLLERAAATIVRRRRSVCIVWLLISVAGIILAGTVAGRLTSAEHLTGLPSYQAGLAIEHQYGTGGNDDVVVAAVTLPAGQNVTGPAGRAEITEALSPLAADHVRVAAWPAVADPKLVSPDGRTALAEIFTAGNDSSATRIGDQVRAHAPPGATVASTDLAALVQGGDSGGMGVVTETLIGAVGALIVLVLIFGASLAVVPLAVAISSIMATFLSLGLLTELTPVSQLVEYLVSLIGLGIAIDYSLLITNRWREERANGASNEAAVIAAMGSAGRAVILSGATVAVGLATLTALPISFVRSMGYGGILIPVVTVVSALTLLPALLASLGARLDRKAARGHRRGRATARPSRAWAAWGRLVTRHRILAIGAALLILGSLALAATGLRLGEPRPGSLAQAGPAATSLSRIEAAGAPVGSLQPIEVLLPAGADPASVSADLRAQPGVHDVLDPSGPSWRHDGTALVAVIPVSATSSAAGDRTLHAVRSTLDRTAPGAMVAGDGATESDLIHAMYERFGLILLLVALISAAALAVAFRSPVLAIKALLVNALSTTATYGCLVLIWQRGFGSNAIWHIPATGAVDEYVPLLLFAFLFGLSMDYEVFLLSRIREARQAGRSTDEAIVDGLAHTGKLITTAAIILVLAFAAMASGPEVPIKVFATGMGVGILLDATVVRALLVPALISLLGERTWWWPGRRRSSDLPSVAQPPSPPAYAATARR